MKEKIPVERPSPATDPTNPFHQETCGIFRVNEQATERRVDEPGLTEGDRAARDPSLPADEPCECP